MKPRKPDALSSSKLTAALLLFALLVFLAVNAAGALPSSLDDTIGTEPTEPAIGRALEADDADYAEAVDDWEAL